MDVHAFDFVEQGVPPEQSHVVALFGDDPFLQSMSLKHLRSSLLGDDDDNSISEWEGHKCQCQWRDVSDELRTVSLFGAAVRVAVVRQADDFVSEYREQLENYVSQPAKASCLVLIVKSWPKNTKRARSHRPIPNVCWTGSSNGLNRSIKRRCRDLELSSCWN